MSQNPQVTASISGLLLHRRSSRRHADSYPVWMLFGKVSMPVVFFGKSFIVILTAVHRTFERPLSSMCANMLVQVLLEMKVSLALLIGLVEM